MYLFLYPFYAFLSLFATVFSWFFIDWWAPIFSDANGNLPSWLKWFQTFDGSMDCWKGGFLPPVWGTTRLRRFAARVYWLYRNTAYGVDYYPLGVPFDKTQWKVVKYNSTTAFYAKGPNGQFNWEGKIGPIHIKLGWKAWNYVSTINADGSQFTWQDGPWGPEMRVPATFSISRWKDGALSK